VRASLFLLLLLAPAFADKPPVPRTADGHPDLSGVWQGGSLSFAVGVENAKKAGQSAEEATGKPSYAPGQESGPPYQPWAAAKRKEYLESARNRRSYRPLFAAGRAPHYRHAHADSNFADAGPVDRSL
jgi:hypothetical protein